MYKSRAKLNILNYLRAIGPGGTFKGMDIVNVAYWHTLSALRMLRKLRGDGVIDYQCIDRKRSVYRLIDVR